MSHSWILSYSVSSQEQGTQSMAVWTVLFPSLHSPVGPLTTSRRCQPCTEQRDCRHRHSICKHLRVAQFKIHHRAPVFSTAEIQKEKPATLQTAHVCFRWKEPVPSEASSPSPGAPSCYQRAYSHRQVSYVPTAFAQDKH